MSLTVVNGTAMAMMLRMQPEPKSKKNFLPLPSSTMMQVPACDLVTGSGVLPMKEIRISSGPICSWPG